MWKHHVSIPVQVGYSFVFHSAIHLSSLKIYLLYVYYVSSTILGAVGAMLKVYPDPWKTIAHFKISLLALSFLKIGSLFKKH